MYVKLKQKIYLTIISPRIGEYKCVPLCYRIWSVRLFETSIIACFTNYVRQVSLRSLQGEKIHPHKFYRRSWQIGKQWPCRKTTLIARFMGPTWGSSGADGTQVGPLLAPWTLLSRKTTLSIMKSCSKVNLLIKLPVSPVPSSAYVRR